MTIRYEYNPPKISNLDRDIDTTSAIDTAISRIKQLSLVCDAVHLTENVLGFARMSPLRLCELVRKEVPNLSTITVSLRVRDKTELEILHYVEKCVSLNISGVLVLMGDKSKDNTPDTGQYPSGVINMLKEHGLSTQINLYMSIPSVPNYSKITKKLNANPKGFMTQVIHNADQVQDISSHLTKFDIIPILMYPSSKNEKSATLLKLDMSSYADNFETLIRDIHHITHDVLITSPCDFKGSVQFLKSISI